jgi:translation initiation factor IF-2
MELKAPCDTKASGIVVETRIDPSKGVIATLLIEKGTLKLSDIIVAGTAYGKIRKINDDKSKGIKQALPSMPVEILGLSATPDAGDKFFVIKEEKQARDIIAYREKKKREEKSLKNSVRLSADVFKESGQETTKFLPVIIKGDVAGSVEALENNLLRLNTKEVAIKIIHSATGGIIESDINLAEISEATILGFNVKGNAAAKEMARTKGINIRRHSVIYHAVDEFREILENLLSPIISENYLGKAEIRQVFKVSKSGKIGGSMVTDGTIKKGFNARLIRGEETIYEGTLKTLKRFKEDVKEVKFGFECGCALENYEDIQEGDIIECYEIVKTKRKL